MEELIAAVMESEGIEREEAVEVIDDMRVRVNDGEDVYDVLSDYGVEQFTDTFVTLFE
jgi:hypothetical protein